MSKRALDFYQEMNQRRSLREFSNREVAKSIISSIIQTASTSPSGAHKQPWKFCAVSSPEIKRKIRKAAELEEEENYRNRMSDEWKSDLEKMATDAHKPFLETAPWLIVVFKEVYGLDSLGRRHMHYYVNESVGIVCGFLLAAIHNAGLVALTHTPSPMNFLTEVLYEIHFVMTEKISGIFEV
ncbi:nitroreductase family protein [Membranihabitans marinus]|uniref:nitroreductase family protein n=1 Tax=Membranihabitans marinus TaxID=1227546 RepID=UPI001F2C21ED|nr:nitroreductase family protein [Membranihabitans marinus]